MDIHSNLLHAFVGGTLIGAGAATLLLFNGRVAGISGITAELLRGAAGPGAWRLAFIAGLVLPALLFGVGEVELRGGYGWLALAGLLVGVGTQVGSGCTSGHGVCGLSNLSLRSLVATATFMAVAMATVLLSRLAGVA